MKGNELIFDRKSHVLYSKPCKKEILAKIALHYPEAERETVWEKVQRQYAVFLSDWRTDLGGKKNFHNSVGGTYDCIVIMSYYTVCKAVTSFREIEEMEETLILPTFRRLRFVDCNKPFWRRLMGKLSFLPAFIGFWVGVLFLLLLDHLIPHLHVGSEQTEGPKSKLGRTTMMVLAVTLHNIPEGMAVGVVYAGFLSGNTQITAASALALSLGIAIQNFPEGAIISMPLRAEGERKGRAFLGGVLSGVVEPIGAVLTLLAAQLVIPALPYLLSFAAGAMLYVVVEELIPEMSQGRHSNLGTVFFAVGFSVMMVLDVALG